MRDRAPSRPRPKSPDLGPALAIRKPGGPRRALARRAVRARQLLKLTAELRRALAYPKLRYWIPDGEAKNFIDLLVRNATTIEDPSASTHKASHN